MWNSPGYFKGAVFQGAMTGSDAFFPIYEETEGIVVPALASHRISLVLRGIFPYTMADRRDVFELCHNVDERLIP